VTWLIESMGWLNEDWIEGGKTLLNLKDKPWRAYLNVAEYQAETHPQLLELRNPPFSMERHRDERTIHWRPDVVAHFR
jgi:hypothetical protein